MDYSILMTVYDKESPDNFEAAVLSMLNQTVPANDFVLVCDGALNKDLRRVIDKYADRLRIVELDENVGTSRAANIGLAVCKNELIARMDSDDISLPDRCEKQLKVYENHPEFSIVGGTVQEFIGSPETGLLQKRVLPENQSDIIRFSYKRSPFSQPSVMFKKNAVIKAGGYPTDFDIRFEDYDLWVRMLQNGAIGYNIPDVLVYMRVSEDFYERRGGWDYAGDLLRFYKKMIRTGWCGRSVYFTAAIPHAIVCVMPNSFRKRIYGLLRK